MKEDQLENLRDSLDLEIKKFEIDSMVDNSIDTKTSVFIGFIITILIGILTLKIDSIFNMRCVFQNTIVLIFLLIFFGLSFLFYVIWPKRYNSVSTDIKSTKELINTDRENYLKQLILNCNNARMKNKDILDNKLLFFKGGLVLSFLGLILLSILAMI